MTNVEAWDRLREHRPLLLACEAIGWLHMAGKARIDFLQMHGGQENGYDYKAWGDQENWDNPLQWVEDKFKLDEEAWPETLTAFITEHAERSSKSGLVSLLQAGHAMASGIEKNLPADTSKYLGQDVTHMWMSSAFGTPVRNLLADPPEALTEAGWKRLLEQIKTLLINLEVLANLPEAGWKHLISQIKKLLEDLKALANPPERLTEADWKQLLEQSKTLLIEYEALGNLTVPDAADDLDDWWNWREGVVGPDGWLRRAFTSTLAETRLPNNDVTLFDQSYVAAALFKSAVAGAVLEGSKFPWSGKGLKQAMAAGYGNAFSAILDSNVTSLLTGIILYIFGTGPIRGFATTWMIGIVCSFFSAVYLTRLVYEHQLKKDRWMNLNFTTRFSRNLMQDKAYRFMAMYKKTFTFAAVSVIVFVGSFIIRGLAQSIDFTGGRNYVVQFEKPVEPEEVRSVLIKAFPESTTGALALGTDNKTIRISTNYKIESNSPTIDDEVETKLYNALKADGLISQKNVQDFKNPDIRQGGSIISSTKVGPSVAKDITNGAIVSVIIALVAIFLYILIRFRNVAFSVGSTIALALDALTVIGLFSLLQGFVPFSLEIDQTFIGAILTVIGYSINDKVVVFDRIRENLRLHPKQDIQSLFNDSINQTLSRTINTSFSTLIVLLCILFFGGKSIQPFAFAMTMGVIFGTLSSIFIASPIAYLVMGRKIKEDVHADVEAVKA